MSAPVFPYKAYVAGFPTGAKDVKVQVLGDNGPDELIVKFSEHDHGRHIPRGAVKCVSTFYVLSEAEATR